MPTRRGRRPNIATYLSERRDELERLTAPRKPAAKPRKPRAGEGSMRFRVSANARTAARHKSRVASRRRGY